MFEEYLQYYLFKSWIGRAIVLYVTRYVESCTKFHVQMCARQFSDTPFVSVVISAIAVFNNYSTVADLFQSWSRRKSQVVGVARYDGTSLARRQYLFVQRAL